MNRLIQLMKFRRIIKTQLRAKVGKSCLLLFGKAIIIQSCIVLNISDRYTERSMVIHHKTANCESSWRLQNESDLF